MRRGEDGGGGRGEVGSGKRRSNINYKQIKIGVRGSWNQC